MKRFSLRSYSWVAAGAFALLAGGCVGGYVEADGGPTPVYGEFGYTGAWGYDGPAYDERGAYVHPPFHRDDHHDDHRGPGPARGAPASHSAPHSAPHAPSIPSAPRPGGGAPHGGGGTPHAGGGGGHTGGDHRH